MSKKRMPFRGRRATALAGVGLMLAQLAAAGQPARVHFGYGQNDKSELCLTWDENPSAAIGDDSKLHLVGHLYHGIHGAACGFAPIKSYSRITSESFAGSRDDINHGPASLPFASVDGFTPVKPGDGNGHGPMTSAPINGHGPAPSSAPVTPEPLADQTIHLSYKVPGDADSKRVLPESLTTDSEGRFELDVFKAHLLGGMVVKAAYYGQMDESGEPLAQSEKKLLPPHLEVDVLDENDSPIDPDKNPVGPEGIYQLRAHAVGWYGEDFSSGKLSKLEELKPLVTPGSAVDPVLSEVSGLVKEIKISGLSVEGKGAQPGIATVRAVMGEFKSEPVALPFGAKMMLERAGTDTHSATEEVILQRPKGYNDDEGHGGEFFMDEHAQLELKLTSLLSGNPLKGMPVSWNVGSQVLAPNSGKMGVFLSEKVDSSRPEKGVTGEGGVVSVPVSARHAKRDTGNGGGRVYTPAAGKVSIQAEFNGQTEEVVVPFVDSLWLNASLDNKTTMNLQKLPVWGIRPVSMTVEGYVGPDGGKANRELVPWRLNDHSVVVDGRERDQKGSGPVSFVTEGPIQQDDGILELTNEKGARDNKINAGLAFRRGGEQGKLTGYLQGVKAGPFCLKQGRKPIDNGPGNLPGWWSQAGVTLELPKKVCGEVVLRTPKPAAG